jgi:thiol:disulfide interchange protein DsbD
VRASCLLVAAGLGAVAASVPAQPEAADHATVTLWAPKPRLEPGQPEILVLDFTIDDGWHLYWNGLNDSGVPPEIKWKLPPGYELTGPVLWPAPTRHVSPGPLVDHIYEKRVMLMAPIRAPRDARGTAHIEADVHWLVCKNVCLPGGGHVAIDLPAGPNDYDDIPFDPNAADYEKFRARLPVAAPKDAGVRVTLSGDSCDIRVPGAKKITFFPLKECTPPADLVKEGVAEGEVLHMALKPRKGKEPRVVGVLEVAFGAGSPPKFWTVDTAPPPETK